MSEVQFPESLAFLFEPARYKVAYGGRGSGKSWGMALALLIQGAEKPIRVLCAREFQKSISDSVHSLLADHIARNPALASFYTVQNTSILGRNGTEFIFAGLRHNIASIKSIEGNDRCWIEEAQTITKGSLDVLIPTIRKEGSEIWLGFNPELAEDEVYRRFVLNPPRNAIVRKVNWDQNPFFPVVLREEMQQLKATDYDAWLNVWQGNPKQVLEGAIYANEIRQATDEQRICHVEYDPSAPVFTAWDLGWSDMTSIWFWQKIGFDIRVIDFYQNRMEGLDHYVGVLERRGYKYERHFLPHDANQGQLSAGGKTIAAQLRARSMPISVLPQLPIVAGISAARTLFPRVWFDEQATADGMNALRRYRYDVDQQTGQFSKKPLHDDASHGADAFRMLAVAINDPKPKAESAKRPRVSLTGSTSGWMGL